MKIIGHHRSRKLAERHARDEGMVIVDRRNKKGYKSRRGHIFIFETKLMWQYTLVQNHIPIKKQYFGLRVQTWARTRASLRIEAARAEFMAIVHQHGAGNYPWSKRWFDVAEETTQVEFDKNLIGQIETGKD